MPTISTSLFCLVHSKTHPIHNVLCVCLINGLMSGAGFQIQYDRLRTSSRQNCRLWLNVERLLAFNYPRYGYWALNRFGTTMRPCNSYLMNGNGHERDFIDPFAEINSSHENDKEIKRYPEVTLFRRD